MSSARTEGLWGLLLLSNFFGSHTKTMNLAGDRGATGPGRRELKLIFKKGMSDSALRSGPKTVILDVDLMFAVFCRGSHRRERERGRKHQVEPSMNPCAIHASHE